MKELLKYQTHDGISEYEVDGAEFSRIYTRGLYYHPLPKAAC
jgi:hypothetical protein